MKMHVQTKIETPRCTHCGYFGITTEARLEWNISTQQWDIADFTGYSTCGKCNEDTDYDFVETNLKDYQANLDDYEWKGDNND